MINNKNESMWKRMLFSLLSIILVFSAILPSFVMAADYGVTTVESSIKYTTVHRINTSEFELTLKLTDGKKWASDMKAKEKEKLLVEDIQATQEKEKWNKYKHSGAITTKKRSNSEVSDILTNADRSELTLVFDSDASYNIDVNQSITININSALIEEWPGEVTPVNFMIYAKPQIKLGGSITKDTTLDDLQKGGKEIELQLLNAKWNEEHIAKITNFNRLLDSFKDSQLIPRVWDVANALKNTDPNEVISYSADKRTLKIKLPAVTSIYFGNINITIPQEFYTIEKVDSDGVLSNIGTVIPGNIISTTTLTINTGRYSIPGMEPLDDLKEINLKKTYSVSETKPTLTLKLKNAKWNQFDNEREMLLLDSIQARNQTDQWEIIKGNLSRSSINKKDSSTVEIVFPTINDLQLVEDMVLSLNIPYQLLENDVKIPEQQFSIKVQPKVLLSGSAMPDISRMDFVEGGKTFVLTLVNAEWQRDVATNTVKRENLLKSFKWESSVQETILARADVERKNSSTVTIKLPVVSDKLTKEITFESKDLTGKGLLENDSEFLSRKSTIKVKEVNNQSAVITGTAAINLNDLDIVKGEKTVVISLKNDIWESDLEKENRVTPIQLVTDSGKNIEYTISKNNDTTATLKLKADNSFKLTEDQNVKMTIPKALLGVRTSDDFKIDSAFKVSAVTASLSGTGINLDPVDVQKGNKTLIITLNNADFKDNLSVADVKGMFESTGLPWDFTLTDFTVAKNKLTIKLPAVPTYPLVKAQSFKLIITNSLLKGYNDMPSVELKNIEDSKVTIGEIGSAALDQTSIMESDIQAGGRSLTITLKNVEWDDAITTNTSKKSALLKGFSVTDQTKEWGIASAIIAKEGDFSIEGKKLTIKLPKNPNYSIIRDQNIALTIPKTVLKNYKYDIQVEKNLLIEVPPIDSKTSFLEILQSGLVVYIEEKKLSKIRVEVPEKAVQKISTYAAQFGANTFTTVEVETDDSATKVVATIISDKEETKEQKSSSDKVNNKFTFIFSDVEEKSTLKVDVYNDSDNIIESSFNKLAKGNKVFINAPKSPINGSYSLHSLLTDKSLMSNILKYYDIEDLKIGTLN